MTMPTQAGVPESSEKRELFSDLSHFDVSAIDGASTTYAVGNLTKNDTNASMPLTRPENKIASLFENSARLDMIRLARAFIVENGNEFQWLIRRLKTSAGAMTTGTTEAFIRRKLMNTIGKASEITLDLDWNPAEFTAAQYRLYNGVECRLQEVICLCGAGDDVEAFSCGEYASRMWPGLGPKLLEFVSSAVSGGASKHRGSVNLIYPLQSLADDAKASPTSLSPWRSKSL